MQNEGTIVVGGLKAGDEFGIDTYSWQVGWKFEGLNRVPLGLHLLVFGSVSRQGVFLRLDPNAVIIKDWDGEQLMRSGGDRILDGPALEAARRAAARPGSLNLGQYPEEHKVVWSNLSSHITEATLERCGLKLDLAFACDDEETWEDNKEEFSLMNASNQVENTQNRSRNEEELDGVIATTTAPSWTPLPGISTKSRQRTVAHMDGSERALAMARTVSSGRLEELLAEIQLAFIIFLAIGSLEALKQWQRLVSLLCSCDSLLTSSNRLADQLGDILRYQLELAPSDFFQDPLLSAEDTLRPALGSYFYSVSADTRSAQLFFTFIQAKFALFDTATSINEARQRLLLDAPEDAPVIVPTAEDIDSDPRIRLKTLGFSELALAIEPEIEDADMAAARLLDTPHTDPALREDATRWLERSAVAQLGQ